MKSVLSDNPEEITDSIGNDMTGSTIAITLPGTDGMPYDPTGADISQFKWRSAITQDLEAGDKGIYLIKPNDQNQGYIANRNQEKIGPRIEGMEDTVGGYEPFSFTAPVTDTYAFRFLSSSYLGNDPTSQEVNDSESVSLESSDYFSLQRDSTVAAWDVTVVNNGVKQEGRVWTDVLFVNTGDHGTPVNSEIYTLTDDGFEYRVNLNGIEPFGFALYSNNRGVLLDQYNMAQPDGERPTGENGEEVTRSFDYLRSLGHSFYSYTDTYDVGPGPVRTETDDNGR